MPESPYDWMTADEYGETLILKHQVEAWLTRFFGQRCQEYDPECECCKRWKLLDALFGDV